MRRGRGASFFMGRADGVRKHRVKHHHFSPPPFLFLFHLVGIPLYYTLLGVCHHYTTILCVHSRLISLFATEAHSSKFRDTVGSHLYIIRTCYTYCPLLRVRNAPGVDPLLDSLCPAHLNICAYNIRVVTQ
ncbi:conserved hypothetical protein, unlikely [Trypanosoma brucei gambiense DAL972]|uniref:Uncharacterized protein n=1 Tax=Trypanosoma brucei gambiense (strain MHOM/CI/86/DAL972) TaxID=679716 RepID=C9ZZM1_TRYB9|nr:conserved hypothetical protein, unlikely [Trypanosoma brucei gambiense DAL972]CBH14870.1 conserved hypothetical protein, unlikely [Trypanosoma brucei gambiense DAL972]|eukprot:XP_011777136.1 conserved hypothetical protein, unlikely [Trypanosoma brucei gambiense DAL972]